MFEPWLDCVTALGEEFSSHLLKGTCYQYDLKFFIIIIIIIFAVLGLCCVGELFTVVMGFSLVAACRLSSSGTQA